MVPAEKEPFTIFNLIEIKSGIDQDPQIPLKIHKIILKIFYKIFLQFYFGLYMEFFTENFTKYSISNSYKKGGKD